MAPLCIVFTLMSGCSRLDTYHAPARSGFGPAIEDYAFYSSVYRTSTWLEPSEVVAISERIIATARSTDLACFKPRNAEERGLEKLALQLDGKRAVWKTHFEFGRPYKILSEGDAIRAENCIASHGMQTNESCKPFRGIKYVRYLSLPAFNREHTRALISIWRVCGGVCGEGSVQVYVKTNGIYRQELPTFVRCWWVS